MKQLILCSMMAMTSMLAGCGEPNSKDKGSSGSVKPTEVNDSDFQQVVLDAEKPVLVDFWADWCGPCKTIAPIVEEIANDYDGRAIVAKLDIDAARETTINYNVTSIPTLILFHKGQEVSRVVGVVDKSELTSMLDKVVK